MKKRMFIIYPLLFGLICGLLIEAGICFLAIGMSPFATLEESLPNFIFYGITALLSVLAMAPIIYFYVKNIINLDEANKFKKVIIQAVIGIAWTLIFWALWEFILRKYIVLF